MEKGNKSPKSILRKYLERYTDFEETQIDLVLNQIPVKAYKKGTCLLTQGEVPTKCYFVLSGCVRQYMISETGKETTFNFYTEDQAVTIYNQHKSDKTSDYTLVCLEDCVLVVGDLNAEQDMYEAYPELAEMTRQMMIQDFGNVQQEFAQFMASSPEERYRQLVLKRPGLVDRVPQNQLATYLGITPESLSRIKKRFAAFTD